MAWLQSSTTISSLILAAVIAFPAADASPSGFQAIPPRMEQLHIDMQAAMMIISLFILFVD
jgi:hypothetical protein